MFKNRELTIKMDKRNKTAPEENTSETETFEKKADTVQRKLESLGAKMFLGACVYILLDTYRQVKVAEATHRSEK